MSENEIYAVARGVLLDALEALRDHRGSLILVGAQAIYLRVGEEPEIPVAPFTKDGDLAIDPSKLLDKPAVEAVLARANFTRAKPDTIGVWSTTRMLTSRNETFTVDLLVPSASKRRAARLVGHDLHVARNVAGLEGALVDHDVMTIGALDPRDRRELALPVAGCAALLVAKAHKIHERLDTDRLNDKDALDVVRLLRRTSLADVCARFDRIRADDRSATIAERGLELFTALFTSRRSRGVEMAARAVGPDDAAELAASCVALANDLVSALDP